MSAGRGWRVVRWSACLFCVVVGIAVWRLAFAPRERPGSPSPEMATLAAWARERWEIVVWLPHPHQNLGALGEAVGDLEAYLAAGARASGRAIPRWPAFGPFEVPPGRELLLAVGGEGGEGFAAARLDPPIAWLARLSGRLAGNPWLAGGEVTRGGMRWRVRWRGPLWTVEPAAAELPATLPPDRARDAESPRLAELWLQRAWGPLPPADYRLTRRQGELELVSGALPAGASPLFRFDAEGLVLWSAEAAPGPAGGPGLFLLWEGGEGVVPRAAVLQRGEGETYELPGERLLEIFGVGPKEGRRLGWSIRATDRLARRGALEAVPWFERELPRPGSTPWLAAAMRLETRRAGELLRRIGAALEKIPLVPPKDRERWQAGALLLRPFAECGPATLEVWREPDGTRLRLCPPPEPRRLPSRVSSGEDVPIDDASDLR